MRNRLITVFGGTGFIGRHLVRRLAARGARICVISRDPARGTHLQPMGDVGQIVIERADLASEAALARVVEGALAVVNLIGILYETGRQTFAEVQGELPGRIGRAAAAAGVARLVQLSAIGADPQSASAYARSKAEGERAVREAFPGATIMRPSIVVGPEDGFFNRFAAMARLFTRAAADRRRPHPVPAGLRRRRGGRDRGRPGTGRRERPDLRARRPPGLQFAQLMRYLLQVIGRRRLLVPVSFEQATWQARILELLPVPPLTRDQVELLKTDNVVGADARTLADLGITPTPIELVVPEYLGRYRASPARVARL